MSGTIIYDADDVLLNWHDGFLTWMHSQGFNPETRERTCYNFSAAFPSMPESELAKHIHRFNTSAEFSHLTKMPGALDAVRRLRRVLPDYLHVVVTACGTNPYTVMRRASQLIQFAFDQVHVVDLGGSKEHHFRRFRPAVVIDDSLTHLRSARLSGCTGIAFRQPWNTEWDGLSGKDWAEIVDLVPQILNRSPRIPNLTKDVA